MGRIMLLSQRHVEICLSVIQEASGLTKRFIENYSLSWKEPFTSLSNDGLSKVNGFFWSWTAVSEQVDALFSGETANAFKELYLVVGLAVGGTRDRSKPGPLDIEKFNRAKTAAFRALYAELGVTSGDFELNASNSPR